jgi:histidyl-tRNA synthetase
MCEDCQRRAVTNPLRVLDCKVPADQPIIDSLPRIADSLDPESQKHFAQVLAGLDAAGVPYTRNHRLVRGLDYYTRTTFEFTHGGLGAQNALLGGGRYDGLSESIGDQSWHGRHGRRPFGADSTGIELARCRWRLCCSVGEKLNPAAWPHARCGGRPQVELGDGVFVQKRLKSLTRSPGASSSARTNSPVVYGEGFLQRASRPSSPAELAAVLAK